MRSLQQVEKAELTFNFFEGMACVGGCVGGPGTLNDPRVTGKMLENLLKEAKKVTAADNAKALAAAKAGGHWHRVVED